MRLTVINGSELDNASVLKCLECIDNNLGTPDLSWEIIDLGRYPLKRCIGCDACQYVNPGVCAIADGLNEILTRYLESDKVIIFTSIRFGSFNAKTKNFIDRTEPLFLPYQIYKNGRTRMKSRYDHYPDLLFAGILNDEDAEAAAAFRFIASNSSLAAASENVEIIVLYCNDESGSYIKQLKEKGSA